MMTKNSLFACASAVAIMALFSSCGDNGNGGGNGPSNAGLTPVDNIVSSGLNVISDEANSSVMILSSSGGAEPNLDLGVCSVGNDGEIKRDAYYGVYYACDNGDWRMATDSEEDAGFGCTALGVGEERLVAGYMLCSEPGVWTASTHTVSGTITDHRNGGNGGLGISYKTIGIGTQTWMAENLNYVYGVYGESWWCLENSQDSCAKYGKLYKWGAAIDLGHNNACGYSRTCEATLGKIQGICPVGWHLPSKAEWDKLFNAVGGSRWAGWRLKTTSGWNISPGQNKAGDTYGFSALPSGLAHSGEVFSSDANNAYFWSSTEESTTAYAVVLTRKDDVTWRNMSKGLGAAIRCVKDE